MKIYRGFDDRRLKPKKRAVAIGVFDGVHLGHRKILQRMLRDAAAHRFAPAVVTFDPHPAKVLAPKKFHPTILMSLEHRLAFFNSMGIREVVVVPFTKKFASIGREKFFDELLVKKLGVRSLTVGRDFRFGRKAQGDGAYLSLRCRERGVRLSLVSEVKAGGVTVSSTRVRRLIEKGELEKASSLLGRPVSVVGTVVHGSARGKALGFPTANLDPHHEALPPPAVYAAYGFLNGKKLKGVLHIGERPTFGDHEKTLEVHLLRFHRDLYGRDLELLFVKKLRSIRRFKNAAALQKAIQNDIRRAKTLL